MKLYLSSYRIPTPSDFIKLIGKDPAKTTMALIPNAKDYYAKRARDFKTQSVVDYMHNFGFQTEVVDLWDYDKPSALKQKLQQFDVIWVMGGNTFCLRYEMKRSGFDKIIRELVEAGTVYGGDSAGAAIAGNSLKGVELADEPEFAEEVSDEGLNLIDNFIIPHVGGAEYAEAITKIQALHNDDPKLIELTDYEALVVDGGDFQKRVASSGIS